VSQRLPRILSALGGLALLGTWACFPLPTVVLPGSGPRPTPMPYTPATPHPGTSTPTPPPLLAPTEGRAYTVEDHKAATTRVYVVRKVDGDIVSFDVTTTPPGTTVAKKTTKTNGVFWTEDGDSPVTKDIVSYPAETVTVKGGTFVTNKVQAGANAFWFADGICVKGQGEAVDFELTKLDP
jgi:hypothetical protein